MKDNKKKTAISTLKPHQEDWGRTGIYDKRNPLNNLTGKQWTFSTKTTIPMRYLPIKFESRVLQFSPPDLIKDLVLTFSKAGDHIFLPLVNSGTLPIAVRLADAQDLPISNKKNRLITAICPKGKETIQRVYKELARQYSVSNLPLFKELVIQDDIYFDMILTELVVNGPWKTGYQLALNTSSTSSDIHNWLKDVCNYLLLNIQRLQTKKYFILIFPSDSYYQNTRDNPSLNVDFSNEITTIFESKGLVQKAERVWFEPQKESTPEISLLPIKKHILVFRKEE